jgi:hypothetical protein
MEDLKGQAFLQKKLNFHFVVYGAIAAIFLAALSSSLVLHNRAVAARQDVDNLRQVAITLSKVPQSATKVNDLVSQVSSVLPSDIAVQPPEHFLHMGLDRFKTLLTGSQLAAGKMEARGEETIMPVTLTGNVKDYQAFASGVGRLQEMVFPFFIARGLSLKAAKDSDSRAVVTYEIRGDLSTPNSAQTPESPKDSGRTTKN